MQHRYEERGETVEKREENWQREGTKEESDHGKERKRRSS
jgi:hypothetical protein